MRDGGIRQTHYHTRGWEHRIRRHHTVNFPESNVAERDDAFEFAPRLWEEA